MQTFCISMDPSLLGLEEKPVLLTTDRFATSSMKTDSSSYPLSRRRFKSEGRDEMKKLDDDFDDFDSVDVDSLFTTKTSPTVGSTLTSGFPRRKENVFSKYRRSRFFSPLRDQKEPKNDRDRDVKRSEIVANDRKKVVQSLKSSDIDEDLSDLKRIKDSIRNLDNHIANFKLFDDDTEEPSRKIGYFTNSKLYSDDSENDETKMLPSAGQELFPKQQPLLLRKNVGNNTSDAAVDYKEYEKLSKKFQTLNDKFRTLLKERERERREFEDCKLENELMKVEMDKLRERNNSLSLKNQNITGRLEQLSVLQETKSETSEQMTQTGMKNEKKSATISDEEVDDDDDENEMFNNVQKIRKKVKEMSQTNKFINRGLHNLEMSMSKDQPISEVSEEEDDDQDQSKLEYDFKELRTKFRRFMGKYKNLNRLHSKSRKLNEYYKSKITHGYKKKIRSMRKRIDDLRSRDEKMFEREVKKLIHGNSKNERITRRGRDDEITNTHPKEKYRKRVRGKSKRWNI